MTTDALILTSTYLAWRDEQLEAISEQLESRLPELLDEIDSAIDKASTWEIAWNSVSMSDALKPILNRWQAEQNRVAVRRAQASLDATFSSLSTDLADPASSQSSIEATLPAAAGVGLIAASVALVPTVVSFATITTSTLAIFSTSTVSWPLFAIGASGLTAAALLGSTAVTHAESTMRASYRKRVHSRVTREIIGIGAPRGSRSFLSDLQAAIIAAGRSKQEFLR